MAPLVASGLDECAVLAVASMTPLSTMAHIEQTMEELLSGFGRPIAYATHAREGGSRIVTPESAPKVEARRSHRR